MASQPGTGSGRNGFALIAVLWLVVALSALLSTGLARTRMANEGSANRIAEARSVWGSRACIALIQARHVDRGTTELDGPVALGAATWCSIEPWPWDERVNPNVLDSFSLSRVLPDTTQVASILDWIDTDDTPRDAGAEGDWYELRARALPRNGLFEAVDELARVRGFESWSIEALEALFTLEGDGSVSPDRASGLVLRSIAALSDADIARLATLRDPRTPFESTEAVSLALDLEPTIEEFRELTMRLAIRPRVRLFRVLGWSVAGSRTIRSRMDVTLSARNDGLVLTELELR